MRPSTRNGTAGGRPGTQGGSRAQQTKLESLTGVASKLGTPMYISDRALLPEQETIRFVESLLALPMLSGATEDDLAATAAAAVDGLVTDPDFPPTSSSLYPQADAPPESAADQRLVWRRVAGALYLPSGALPQLLQGCLANGSFLGALAAVACHPDLLLDLIVSDEQAAAGCFTLKFYKHGCWHHVVIDNFLPCVEGEEKLAFACSAHVGELWPSFLEKGYAKLHGSFYALEGGSVADCLTDLTGGVATKVKLDNPGSPVTAGQLWQQLQSWLSEGAIVACKSKPSGAAAAAEQGGQEDEDEDGSGGAALHGYGNVLQHLVYSVLECRQLDNGRTRLVRVHCPWPCPGGLWQGAWALGAPEWEGSAEAKALAAEPLDPACFWVHINDFTRAFNRLYVCRRFPSTWHQLTLHSGWQGPSAGGPYFRSNALQLPEHKGSPSVSSTWCCNPQFCITVRKACEVVVAVSQMDPRVEARSHVRKSHRKRSVGMMVLASKADGAGRVWAATKPIQVLDEVPLTAGRELVSSFAAEPGMAYIVVPYTGRAGEESAFVLRAYAGSPLEVEQLPSPLSLVLGGSWTGVLAGGPSACNTWGSNPQYMISAPCRTKVVMSVSRLDVKYAVLKPSPSAEQAVGLYLCTADRTTSEGLASHKSAVRAPSEVVAQSGFTDIQEAVLVTTLEPETPYVLVPALASAGQEAPFELRLMSSVPLELVPLPELCSCVLQGSWTAETAGGCDLAPTWRTNPRYLLTVNRTGLIKVTLSRAPSTASQAPQPGASGIDDMVGFYILQSPDPSGVIKGDMRRAVLAESAFTTTADSSGEYHLQQGVAYVVIPCKYTAGRLGKFSLAVSATTGFSFTPL